MFVAQDDFKSAVAIRLQRHAAVIYAGSIGDGSVACISREFKCQWRRGPVPGFDFLNTSLFIHRFVMTAEIVGPDGAARGEFESGRFIHNMGFRNLSFVL